MYRFLPLMLVAALLAGCETYSRPKPTQQQTQGPRLTVLTAKFSPTEANYIFDKGTGSISGRAYVQIPGGITKTARGSSATLLPATKYAEQRVNAIYGRSGVATRKVKFAKNSDDPRYHVYTRTVPVGAGGTFKFTGIAAGDYFVTTGINWNSVDTAGKSTRRAVALVKRVTVGEGQNVNMVLTTSRTQIASR